MEQKITLDLCKPMRNITLIKMNIKYNKIKSKNLKFIMQKQKK